MDIFEDETAYAPEQLVEILNTFLENSFGSEREFSEKLLRLPHCYQPNDRKREIGPVPTRAEAEGGVEQEQRDA